jgi:glyoxylase-like metal-dependent hydrolase (beta-lactamase superfamily II)/cell division septum initiation protein DivIVA
MPDQSSASTEHAIMQEIAAPLAELPDDPVASVANQDFPVVLRGYDRLAVDAYVTRVTQLVAELFAGRSPQGAVRRALERVGSQVSEILQRAHETAEELTAQSRAEAEERLMKARAEAAEIERQAQARAEEIEKAAEGRARQLDSEVEHIWAERDRIVSDVHKLAEDLAALAGVAATRFPAALGEEQTESIEAFAAEPPAVDPEPEVTDEPAPEGDTVMLADADEPTAAAVEPEQPTAVAEAAVPAVAAAPALIDLMHLGRERIIGCWKVGDVLIDPGPASCLHRLLEALGDERPRALLLTHIHLDHAGSAGSLVARWPDLEVYVHERGAPHLIDPRRLLKSARRLYGRDTDRLWGEVVPVPDGNIRILEGGEQLFDDLFEVIYTPGHAAHHVAYLYDDGTAFLGDVGGVRITPETLTVPPTPPPDVDIEAWHASIDRVASWHPDRLAMTHFGISEDVTDQLAEVSERLDTWAALAHTEDRETFIGAVSEEIERDAGTELLASYAQAAPLDQVYAGLERYWRKRDGDRAERDGVPRDGAERDGAPAASTHAGRTSRQGR